MSSNDHAALVARLREIREVATTSDGSPIGTRLWRIVLKAEAALAALSPSAPAGERGEASELLKAVEALPQWDVTESGMRTYAKGDWLRKADVLALLRAREEAHRG